MVRTTRAGKQRNLVFGGHQQVQEPRSQDDPPGKVSEPREVPQEGARQCQGAPPRLSGHLGDPGPRTEAAEAEQASAGSARSSRSSPESVASALGSHGASRGAWRRVQ